MSLGRLLALAIVLLIAWWVFTKSGLFGRHEPAAVDGRAPIERAREVSRKSAERNAARSSAQTEADSTAPRRRNPGRDARNGSTRPSGRL